MQIFHVSQNLFMLSFVFESEILENVDTCQHKDEQLLQQELDMCHMHLN